MISSVSVFVPLYNHELYIEEALGSALSQTWSPTEILVTDDASTDGSLHRLDAFSSDQIKVIRQRFNLGGPSTVHGIRRCRGDALAILNSDDTWELDKLRQQVDYLDNHPRCGAVFTQVSIIDELGRSWGPRTTQHQNVFKMGNRTRSEWLNYFFHCGNAFCASSVMLRRSSLEAIGCVDGRYVQLQDLDMWVRLALFGYDLHVIQQPLTNYRVITNGANMSANSSVTQKQFTFEYSRLLRHFWCVQTLNDLLAIFPTVRVSDKAQDSLAQFYLARYAAAQPSLHHRLFALETMARWRGDYEAAELAASCEGFTHKSYSDFVAGWPVLESLKLGLRLTAMTMLGKILPHARQRQVSHLLRRFKKVF